MKTEKSTSSLGKVGTDSHIELPGVEVHATRPQLIDVAKLRIVCSELGPQRAAIIVKLLLDILPMFRMDTPTRLHEFLATCAVESGEFSKREEGLNYSAERLLKIFPKYFNAATAAQYARRPQMIANRAYANRMGNGPEASGDGYANRGGGFIQLTGRDIYRRYGLYIDRTSDEARELVRTTDYYAMHSACWLFAVEKGLLDEADANLIKQIRLAVNGGLNGYKEYTDYYKLAVTAIPG